MCVCIRQKWMVSRTSDDRIEAFREFSKMRIREGKGVNVLAEKARTLWRAKVISGTFPDEKLFPALDVSSRGFFPRKTDRTIRCRSIRGTEHVYLFIYFFHKLECFLWMPCQKCITLKYVCFRDFSSPGKVSYAPFYYNKQETILKRLSLAAFNPWVDKETIFV